MEKYKSPSQSLLEEALGRAKLDPREEYAFRHFASLEIPDPSDFDLHDEIAESADLDVVGRGIPRDILLNRHLLNALLKMTSRVENRHKQVFLVDFQRENAVSVLEIGSGRARIRFRVRGVEQGNNEVHTIVAEGDGDKLVLDELSMDGTPFISCEDERPQNEIWRNAQSQAERQRLGAFETEGGRRGSGLNDLTIIAGRLIDEVVSGAVLTYP